MSHSHIILLDQDGLNLLNRIHKNDGDGAALELGQKILSLCNKHGNELNPFCEHVRESRLEPIGEGSGFNHACAILHAGYPGSEKDEVLYFYAGNLLPVQHLDKDQLAWVKRRVDREIGSRSNEKGST